MSPRLSISQGSPSTPPLHYFLPKVFSPPLSSFWPNHSSLRIDPDSLPTNLSCRQHIQRTAVCPRWPSLSQDSSRRGYFQRPTLSPFPLPTCHFASITWFRPTQQCSALNPISKPLAVARHGEAEHNPTADWNLRDPALTEEGRRQAKALRSKLHA